MDYNLTTKIIFDGFEDDARDAAGWTSDEKANGNLDSYNYNPSTGLFDIPNTTVKTINLLWFIQNPDLSDEYLYPKQSDAETVLTQSQYDAKMLTWFSGSEP